MEASKILMGLPLGELEESDFTFFQRMIRELAGIAIADKKKDLITSRLRSRILALGLSSYAEYREYLEQGDGDEQQIFINLLTTNKTEFFRESQHFSYLIQTVLPSLARRSRVSVWCAACSTGEEAYTLAMVLRHHLPSTVAIDILATDIDTHVLTQAQNGVYRESRGQEIPDDYRDKFTLVGRGSADGWMKIADSAHKLVAFRRHNLIEARLPEGAPFDMIFCRNVLIYFNRDTILTLAAKMHRALNPGGLLFVSHTESIPESPKLFRTLSPSIYARQ